MYQAPYAHHGPFARSWRSLCGAAVLVGIVGYIIIHAIGQDSELRQLRRNAKTAEGVVTDARRGYSTDDSEEPPHVEYEFNVDGRTFRGSSDVYIPRGKLLQVNYLPTNPAANTPADKKSDLIDHVFLAAIVGILGVILGCLGYSEKTFKLVADKYPDANCE
jgi:Protein of unknown function (DUF3592)